MNKEITTDQLAAKLNAGDGLQLIDVRELDEWEDGHIAEAKHIALSELTERVSELDESHSPIYIICRSGNRSSKACGYLTAQGYDVINVLGGMMSWTGDVVTGD
ncbi:rhodanese-like domain-containing protein [Paenibacillus sp. GCM10027626]|uniref:rhodanese-like domain-containing protein n=1 Tax=Paenibacillus sp. GCM10027626 TaxID=3273411 RepID=UPI0036388EBC